MKYRVFQEIYPKEVVIKCGNISEENVLLQETELQIGVKEEHCMTIRGIGYVVLDFGRELHARVRILTKSVESGSGLVRIRTGESVSESCADLGEKNAGNDHSTRDAVVTLRSLSDMEFFQTGFRYVRLDFLEDKEISIYAIVAMSAVHAQKQIGSFQCNDERVNKIFETAAYTLSLNIQSYIWDGIKRDRLVWVGDMHPEILGISCLYGKHPAVEKSLRYIKNSTPLPKWMNGIPSYTAWWLIILHDYYMQNKNIRFLLGIRSYIESVYRQINEVVDEQGNVNLPKYFFDWPSCGTVDEKMGVYALWTLCAKCGIRLLSAVNADVSICEEILRKLNHRRDFTVFEKKQCEAFLVYAGIKTAEKSVEFLTRNGAEGFSTFLSYYILKAISDAGQTEYAVKLMKQYYGGMLDMGATSFWEDFDLKWLPGSSPITRFPTEGEKDIHGDFGQYCYKGFRHSLCHGWSCGPIHFLMKEIAGIQILEPGCKSVKIQPKSAGFLWYTVQYPTPYGLIQVKYSEQKFEIKLPKEIIREY